MILERATTRRGTFLQPANRQRDELLLYDGGGGGNGDGDADCYGNCGDDHDHDDDHDDTIDK